MGKLAQLSSVKIADVESFVYTPPDSAYGAGRVLVKPNLAYPAAPPATVSMTVLGAVLRGLRRATPGRIIIVEGVVGSQPALEVFEQLGAVGLLDREMRIAGMEELLTKPFANTLDAPQQYAQMVAPQYLEEYDCVISVGNFQRTRTGGQPHIAASLHNLIGFFPPVKYPWRKDPSQDGLDWNAILQDVYFTIGQYIAGAVVDLSAVYSSPDSRFDRQDAVKEPLGKVLWGDDLLSVDETACRLVGQEPPAYLSQIHALRKRGL